MENRSDIKISGSGNIGNGIYNDIKISGSGRASGDIDAIRVHVSGSGQFQNVRAEEMHISGSSHIDGNLTGGSFHVSGSAHISGIIELDSLHISGSLHAHSGVRARTIRASGSISVTNDIECEEMKAAGAVHTDGLLNADTLEISLSGNCKIGEIGGCTIRISAPEYSPNFFSRLFSHARSRTLTCNTIEANDISIENTIAKSVHGKNVIIGKGCKIDSVEYTDTISIDPDAEVGGYVKI
ncbi:MAG: cell shape determination protein CcmA [Clostridia bacterium]|nr:cell shape determination protein CcmA [Clostridia bacterium]